MVVSRRLARACLPIVFPLAFAWCAPAVPSESVGWHGTIDTLENGAVLVSNPAEGLWPRHGEWRVDVEWRLGAVSGEGPGVFGQVRSLAVDEWGRLYVLDGQAQEIRVFDSAGRFVRTIGREGAGPGEMRRGMALAFAPNGDLWLLDPRNNRISVFDTGGTYVRAQYLPGTFFTTRWPGGFDVEGRFFNYLPVRVTQDAPSRFALVTGLPDGGPRDTIYVPRFDGPEYTYRSPDGRSEASVSVPFTPRGRWRLDPRGYLWSTTTDPYRIVQTTLSHDTVRVIERASRPVPVTPADRSTALEEIAWFVEEGGRIDESRIPDHKPPLVDFFVMTDGSVWVIPSTNADAQNRMLDVFDPEGRFLGSMMLPFRIEASPRPVVRGDALYAVTVDDLGVSYVVKAAIVH